MKNLIILCAVVFAISISSCKKSENDCYGCGGGNTHHGGGTDTITINNCISITDIYNHNDTTVVNVNDSATGGVLAHVVVVTHHADTSYINTCTNTTWSSNGSWTTQNTTNNNGGGGTNSTMYVSGRIIPDAGQANLIVGNTYWAVTSTVGNVFRPISVKVTELAYDHGTPYYKFAMGTSANQDWNFDGSYAATALMNEINGSFLYHPVIIVY